MAQQSIHDSPSSCGTASQSDQMLDTEKKSMFIDRHAAGKGKVTGRERDGWGEAFLKECRRREKAVD